LTEEEESKFGERVKALIKRGELSAAIALCARVGEDAAGLTYVGRALREAGELEVARRTLEQAIETQSEFTLAHFELGEVLSMLGRLDEAVLANERAAELAFDDRWGAKGVWALVLLASRYRQVGREEDAETALRRAVEVDPNYEEAHGTLAALLHRKGNYDEARLHWRKALELAPEYWQARYNLGLTLREQGEEEEALIHLAKAVELAPDYADAHYQYGSLLHAVKPESREEAVRSMQQSIELGGTNAMAHLYIGNWHWQSGRNEDALESYRRAAQLDPQEPLALAFMSDVHQRLCQWNKSIELCERALKLDPTCVHALLNLANGWTVRHDIKRARQYVDAASAATDDESAYHRGVLLTIEEREADIEDAKYRRLADETYE